MEVQQFDRPAEFTEAARPLLMQDEAVNGLMIGIAQALCAGERVAAQPFLAIVRDGMAVVAAALMTPPRSLILSHASADASRQLAVRLGGSAWRVPGVVAPNESIGAFLDARQDVTGQMARPKWSMRVHRLDEVIPPSPVRGRLKRAREAERALVLRWAACFAKDLDEPTEFAVPAAQRHLAAGDVWLWEDGAPVSMAAVARRTPHGAGISLVYTPPELRRRGYASAVIAGLSQHELEAGNEFCFLYTDLANPTSNHIYREVGYHPACDVREYVFAARDDSSG
ncbi:MAG: GNAT family N-acetyltransferase [Planctomycetes bacterium]|nr:GNAT family N-acetyltransferase [Planctomycetota bacterium]